MKSTTDPTQDAKRRELDHLQSLRNQRRAGTAQEYQERQETAGQG